MAQFSCQFATPTESHPPRRLNSSTPTGTRSASKWYRKYLLKSSQNPRSRTITIIVMVRSSPKPVIRPYHPLTKIRVYRTDPDRKRHQIYTGEYTDDIDERCQTYADLSGCNVELHNACDYKVFESANPKPPTVRIPVGAKSNTVAVYNDDSGETVWVGDRTPGFDCRCQRYADRYSVSLRVVFDGGMTCPAFFVPRSVEGQNT